MTCPNCNYIDGWDPAFGDTTKGTKEGFYKLPIEVKRENYYDDRRDVFACPCCKILFISE